MLALMSLLLLAKTLSRWRFLMERVLDWLVVSVMIPPLTNRTNPTARQIVCSPRHCVVECRRSISSPLPEIVFFGFCPTDRELHSKIRSLVNHPIRQKPVMKKNQSCLLSRPAGTQNLCRTNQSSKTSSTVSLTRTKYHSPHPSSHQLSSWSPSPFSR